MITLYHSPGSCSLAVKAALSMSGLPFQTEEISLSKGEHLSEAYKKINPQSKVPALNINGHILTEGAAILLHLAELAPDKKLLPDDATARADAFKWLMFVYSNVHPHYARAFMPARYGIDADDIKEKAETALHDLFSLIDLQLSQHDFIAGDQLTLADLYLVVAIHWEGVLSQSLTGRFPAVANYTKRMLNLPELGDLFKAELA